MIEVPAVERGESLQPPPDQAFLQENTFNIQRHLISRRTLPFAGQPPDSPAARLVATLRRFQTLIKAIWMIRAASAGSS
jgi:hypothetical protein